jgi:hypothetical protein
MDVIVLDWAAEARRVRTEANESRSRYRSGTEGEEEAKQPLGEASRDTGMWRDQQGYKKRGW